MSGKVEFFTKYPKLIEEAFPQYWDAESTWSTMLALHDRLLRCLEGMVRQKHPSLPDKKIYKYARFSLLEYLSGLPRSTALDGKDMMCFYALREWLLGDMDTAEKIFTAWVKQNLINGANATSIKELTNFSVMGEKFLNSDWCEKRTINSNERQSQIFSDLQKILAQGVQKCDAYARLSVKYCLSTRQLQRIAKKFKNDIMG